MKRRIIGWTLVFMLLSAFFAVPAAAKIDLSFYNEEVYAGGTLDLQVFVGEDDMSDYTFQWQFGGLGTNWIDLEESEYWIGTKTNHLKMRTIAGNDYSHWEEIPFRCKVTKGGETKTTPSLYMYIYPTSDIETHLKHWGFGLYEPKVKNAVNFYTKDDITYTANAFAGSAVEISCGGNTATQKDRLANSEVELRREICITENGKTTVSGDRTSYIPYTVGSQAVRIDINMRVIIDGVDLGVYDTKTVYLSTTKPEMIGQGTVTASGCSLLRYPYNESEKLKTFTKGTTLEVVGKTGSYYQVYADGMVGFVNTSLVQLDTSMVNTVIDEIEVTMDEPAAGQKPPLTCVFNTLGCELYHIEPISWLDVETKEYLGPNDVLEEGRSYAVSIWTKAQEGFQFKVDASNKTAVSSAMLNGTHPMQVYKAVGESSKEVVDLTFTFVNVQKAPECGHLSDYRNYNGVKHELYCTVCGETLALEGHQWTDATCTAPKTCSVCKATEGAAAGHKWDAGKVTKEPTTSEAGIKTYTCGVCKTTKTETVAKLEAAVKGVTRLAGADRYTTGFKAADQLKAQLGVKKFDVVVVASGTDFADALSGSYLAAVKNAPILLVRNHKTTMSLVKEYIKNNLNTGGTVYLLGGEKAVPKAMESGLDGFKVKRLGGNTRYDTNLLILNEAGVGNKDILVCTGKGFADSLSASAAERPILLVKDSFTAAQKEFLQNAKGKKYIIGGTSAVSAKVESALKAYGTVKRLGGNTRYETSVLVAQEFFKKPTAAVLAYAQNFPDGLSGGALAAAVDAPLILTANGKDAAAAKYTKGLGIKDGYVLGGSTLISDKTARNIYSMAATDTIKVIK